MKYIVIVMCLLSERYLIHQFSLHRFQWFEQYNQFIFSKTHSDNPWLNLACVTVPLLLLTWLILFLFTPIGFGLVEIILNFILFYYCLGPKNPFYPAFENNDRDNLTTYFIQVNQQMYAVIFWYMILGPLGAVIYRIFALSIHQQQIHSPAEKIFNVLDWIPVRLSGLLYLVVGNFQFGYESYLNRFFSKPNGPKIIYQEITAYIC